MSQKHYERIWRWFASWEVGPGLILPNGWFGRPYDNIHSLTFLAVRPKKMLVELDHEMLLIFTDLKEVQDEGHELVLSSFSQLVVDLQEVDSLTPHAYLYRYGEVRFAQSTMIRRTGREF